MGTNLRPFSIQMLDNGVKYNFHGFEKRYGYPNFFFGYASFTTNFYWRTYKNAKRAIEQAMKIRRYYDARRKTNYKIIVYDNISDKTICEF